MRSKEDCREVRRERQRRSQWGAGGEGLSDGSTGSPPPQLWGVPGVCASGVLGSIFSIGCISVKKCFAGTKENARSQGLWMAQWPHAEAQHPTVFAPEAHSYDCRDYGRRVGDDLAFFAMLCPPDVVVKLGPRTPMAGGTRKASWGGPWAWGQVFVVCLCMGFRVRTRFFASGLNGSVMLSDLATRLFWPRS